MVEFKGLFHLLELARELEDRLDKSGGRVDLSFRAAGAAQQDAPADGSVDVGAARPRDPRRPSAKRPVSRGHSSSPGRTPAEESARQGQNTEGSESTEPSGDNTEYLGQTFRDLFEVMSLSLIHGAQLRKMGIRPVRGLLLSGPPGSGKTMAARELAKRLDCAFLSISGPEIMSKHYGEPEAKLRSIFEDARRLAPAVVFIDEIDSIAPRRDKVEGEVEKRLVAQLLALMDGLNESKESWMVLATTNAPARIDPALRRAGRFDTEILFKAPGQSQRAAIIRHLTRAISVSPGVSFEELARKTEGFVGSDLAALCQNAAFTAIRRKHPEGVSKLRELSDVLLEAQDFVKALSEVSPSILRGRLIETPKISWDDIGGNEAVNQRLKETISAYFESKELFMRAGVKPARGVVLHGPPGTGKTLLAKAVAHQVGARFILVNGPELVTKWIGDTEDRIRELFSQAREASPCIIFFDELDAMAPARGRGVGDSGVSDRVVAQLLTEIDGVNSSDGVLIMAATNRIELLDPALTRAGRLELLVEVPPPDAGARLSILQILMRSKPAQEVSLGNWAASLEGWTGAELEQLVREASLAAIRRQMAENPASLENFSISESDFKTAAALIELSRQSRSGSI